MAGNKEIDLAVGNNEDDGVRVQFGEELVNGIPLEQLRVETPPEHPIVEQIHRDYAQAKAAGLLPTDRIAPLRQAAAARAATGHIDITPKLSTAGVAGEVQVIQKGVGGLDTLDTTMLWTGRVVSAGLCAAVIGYGGYKLYSAFFGNPEPATEDAPEEMEAIAGILGLL